MNIHKKINFGLLIPAIVVYFLGFISIFSTTKDLYLNHLIYFLLGIITFTLIQYLGSDVFVKYSIFFYGVVMILLISLFFIGSTTLGATRWIKIGSLSLQPSEFAKMTLILLGGYFLSKNHRWEWKKPLFFKKFVLDIRFLKYFVFSIPLILLVLVQPDLGTTLACVAIFLGILLISNFPKKYFIFAILLIGIFSNPIWNSLQEYQRERVLIFLNPEADPFGSGYNSIQAKIAVGNGGLIGKGYGKGTQTQLNFLPIFWTDFLIATYAEEWGFVGLIVFLIVYGILIFNIFKICLNATNEKYKFLATGVFIYFVFQFVINFGMNIGLFPVTGIPLPLFSYGGTALFVSFVLLGIINHISLDKSA
jgi:rod shape determining protein RodA